MSGRERKKLSQGFRPQGIRRKIATSLTMVAPWSHAFRQAQRGWISGLCAVVAFGSLTVAAPPSDPASGDRVVSAKPAAPKDTSSHESDAEAREWVKRLGAPEYREREVAARQLLALGPSARPALQEGMQSADLEVRVRAWALLQEIAHSGFEARLKAFVAGDPRVDPPPGWDRFRAIVGDHQAARRLYAEMCRRGGELLAAAVSEEDAGSWIQQLNRKISEARSSQSMTQMRAGVFRQDKELLALLLFLSSDQCLKNDNEAYSAIINLYSLLLHPGTSASLQDPLMLKLFDAWALGRSSGRASYYVLEILSRKKRLETAYEVSKKVLRSEDAQLSALPLAALLVARKNDVKDLSLLERHLSDSRAFTSHHNGRIRKEPIRIQVRDVVLGAAVHLTGQKLEDYGYKHVRPDPMTVYSRCSLLFVEDAEREKALKKWQQWRKAHPEIGKS